LEPDGVVWTDMLLKFIDLPSADDGARAELIRILREELEVYFSQVS
jgi:hypothetical protein